MGYDWLAFKLHEQNGWPFVDGAESHIKKSALIDSFTFRY